ncbi:MAG TPA: hypothetical protein VN970_10440 [Thermoanaerobaculia bacterium]|nr:hypothetical protein [Thermoanaerobaculia bacterium]
MIEVKEILYGIYGGYRLCRFDAQGLAYFDSTLGGFWRSFFAAVLVAPIYFIIVFLDLDLSTVEASIGRTLLLESLAYLILVFAYPLAMHYISEAVDRRQQYFLYIVAYNWASVVLAAIELPVDALSWSELLPKALADTLEIAVKLAILAILWFIARTALKVPRLLAVGLVALDFVLNLIVSSIINARLGIS